MNKISIARRVSPVIELVIHLRFLGFSAARHPSNHVSSALGWDTGALKFREQQVGHKMLIRIRVPKFDGSKISGVFKHRGFSCSTLW